MQFASIRIITEDVDGLAAFYERLLDVASFKPVPGFASFIAPTGTVAIQSTGIAAAMGADVVDPRANRSILVEFRVDDVDTEFARVREWADEIVMEPRTMPWGNRSLLLRDPDGNLVNLFAPVGQGS